MIDRIKELSDDELRNIVSNSQSYSQEITHAANIELTRRGIEISEGVKVKVEESIIDEKAHAIENPKISKSRGLFNVNWKQNIVTDLSAPQLYSKQVIVAFSLIFCIFFGGILLAINFNTVKRREGILPVLLFSSAYTGIMIFIGYFIPYTNTALTILFNLPGAIALHHYFWNKYIGSQFQYRTKPFSIPLIIGIFIIAIVILALIFWDEI